MICTLVGPLSSHHHDVQREALTQRKMDLKIHLKLYSGLLCPKAFWSQGYHDSFYSLLFSVLGQSWP